MATSLQDQLLQAGIVTEEQVKNAENEKKARKQKRFTTQKKPRHVAIKKAKPKKKPQSDLESFYKQRANLERKERKESKEKQLAEKKIKKERHEKVCKLINENKLERPEGDIRFNFVVGNNIKYIFVNEEEQKRLAEGELAITFLKGKKVLIPSKTATDINAIDPNKIVVLLN